MYARTVLLVVAAIAMGVTRMAAGEEKLNPDPVPRWTKHIFILTGKPDLQCVATPVPERSIYGAGKLVQLSPTQAGLFCGVRPVGIPVIDLNAGADLIIFDALDKISEKNAIPVTRNHKAVHPRNGAPLVMVRNHVVCGFVPLGARLADGSPHPAAGTGFGLGLLLGFPPDHSDLWAAARKDIHSALQLQQYRYDGRQFTIVSDRILDPKDLIPGWEIGNVSLDNPMPDGRDFLVGLVARDGKLHPKKGCAMSRWQCANGEWKPVNISYVEGSEGSFEPSAVRDRDGAILLSVRRGTEFNVWRSTDQGQTWKQIIQVDKTRASSPVTIHRTLGGAPFLCANPYVGPYKDGVGRDVDVGRWREVIAFWPLRDDRAGVEQPSFSFDFNRARFGPSPNGSATWADHPISGIVRLADGKLHCLLCLRVWSRDEISNEVLVTPLSGTWIKEVHNLNDGIEIPVWKF